MGETNIGALTSGLLKIGVAAGVATPATAVEGTDYVPGTIAAYPTTGNYKAYSPVESVLLAMAGGVSKYDPIYVLAAGTAGKAISHSTKYVCIGIAVANASAGNAVSILSDGLITYSTWAFTIGADIFVGTDGVLTETCPSTSQYWTQKVGEARTATCIKIKLGPMVRVQ
jgi:hypothetical protein